jgi:hypothetical protein
MKERARDPFTLSGGSRSDPDAKGQWLVEGPVTVTLEFPARRLRR